MKEFYKKYERECLFAGLVLYFFIFYPLINFASIGRDAHILKIAFDEVIPFIPVFMLIYLSGFIQPMFLYLFIKDKKYFRKAAFFYFLMLSAAYIVYLIYPVEVILRADFSASIFAPLFSMYAQITPPYNAFPSLHVAQPLFASLVAYNFNKKYWWLIIWALLVAVSVLFTKYHYFLDLIAGLVLCTAVYLLFLRSQPKKGL